MIEFIKILVENGYQSYVEAFVNPYHIESISENYDRKVRVSMDNGEFFDTCYTMPKIMEIINGERREADHDKR